MNKKKVFRQVNLIESFNVAKKLKMESDRNSNQQLDPRMEKRDLLATAAEKRMAQSKSSEFLKNIDEALKQSVNNIETSTSFPSLSSNFESDQASLLNKEGSFTELCNSQELFPSSSEELDIFSNSQVKKMLMNGSNPSSPLVTPSPETSKTKETTNVGDDLKQIPLSLLNRLPSCGLELPKLKPSNSHTIMFSIHSPPNTVPRPFPREYEDKWDAYHVRMPCSPENKFPVKNEIRSRWELINRSLRQDIATSAELEQAIMVYNRYSSGRWDFRGLHEFINVEMSSSEKQFFFLNLLPSMISLALQLPFICTQPVPLLKRYKNHSVTLSQKQIGCLLANAFFCTFPRRTIPTKYQDRKKTEYFWYPEINFSRLFGGSKNGLTRIKAEKLKCLINYFGRITEEEPTGTVTFTRQYLQELPKWEESLNGFKTTVVRADGLIERDGYGMLQVDFANKFIGGGVLGGGGVQEEIRFVICPELIISKLFVECLDITEVVIITGVEQYNKYSGYAETFRWEGDYRDQTERDAWGRRCTQIVAMDAKCFNQSDNQYKLDLIRRELNKAFCGFYEEAPPMHLSAVATGNWGCGAFRGNPHLKFLIQMMAASQAGRGMLYFTFGNVELQRSLIRMYQFLLSKNLSIGDLWRLLENYCSNIMPLKKELRLELYEHIYNACTDCEDKEDSNETNNDDTEIDSDNHVGH